VVINSDGQDALGAILSDNVLVELFVQPAGCRDLVGEELVLLRGGPFFLDDLATKIDALVADVDSGRPGNQPPNLFLALATE